MDHTENITDTRTKQQGPRIKLTVCTPVYNTGDRLQLISSLLDQQTDQDFEWVIVDDGSNDGSPEKARECANETHTFPMQFLSQKHGGRHTAINRALKAAKGEFFVVLDTDLNPTPHAFERMFAHWAGIPPQERPYFVSVTGLVALPDGNIDGDKFPADPFDSNSIEIGTHYGINGRKWGMVLTENMHENPYPVFKAETFVPDELLLNRIGKNRLTRFVNDVLVVADTPHQPNNDAQIEPHTFYHPPLLAATVTKAQKNAQLRQWIESPRASSLFYNELSAQRVPLAHRIRACAQYVRFSMHAGIVPDDIYKQAEKKLITFFMLWPGLILYKRDRRKTTTNLLISGII